MSTPDHAQKPANDPAKRRAHQPEDANSETLEQQPVTNALIQRTQLNPRLLTPRDILQLQRTIGNQAIQRLLANAQHNPSTQHTISNPLEITSVPSPQIQRLKDEDEIRVISLPEVSMATKQGRELPTTVHAIVGDTFAETKEINKADIDDGGRTYKGKVLHCVFESKPTFQQVYNAVCVLFPRGEEEQNNSSDLEEDKEKTAMPEARLVTTPQHEIVENRGLPKQDKGQTLKEGEPQVRATDARYLQYEKIIGTAFINDDPKSSDVEQGIGNCYFMATIAALADKPEGKAFLKQAIMSSQDNATYLVLLADIRGDKFVMSGDVEVTAWFPTRGGTFAYALGTKETAKAIKPGATVALWPAIMEKAYAIHQERRKALQAFENGAVQLEPMKATGNYALLEAGNPQDAFRDLRMESETLDPTGKSKEEISNWLQAHREVPIVAGTRPRIPGFTSLSQQVKFQERDSGWFYKHYTRFSPNKFAVHSVQVNFGVELTSPEKAAIKVNNVTIGAVDFQNGIIVLKKQSVPDPNVVRIDYGEEYNEDSIPVPDKHALMVKTFSDDEVILYDTAQVKNIPVSYADLAKYFLSLVAQKPDKSAIGRRQ